MGAVASQITSLMIVYPTVYSDADQTKHQSSASLAFVRGIHRWLVKSPHKWPVTRKMFPFDDVIMIWQVGNDNVNPGAVDSLRYLISHENFIKPYFNECILGVLTTKVFWLNKLWVLMFVLSFIVFVYLIWLIGILYMPLYSYVYVLPIPWPLAGLNT